MNKIGSLLISIGISHFTDQFAYLKHSLINFLLIEFQRIEVSIH